MFRTSKINQLRSSDYMLTDLPGSIFVPGDDHLASKMQPIVAATLDEVAFAILDSEKAYNAAGDRLFALRRLYNLARQAGGIGSDCAAERASQISKAR